MVTKISDERLQYIIDGLLSVGETIFDEAGHALEDMRVAASILAKLNEAGSLNVEYQYLHAEPRAWVLLNADELAYLVRLTAGAPQ